jgi:hypothetical protein
MLNFLKKAIQDPMFSDSIRHGESSPRCLRWKVASNQLTTFSLNFAGSDGRELPELLEAHCEQR